MSLHLLFLGLNDQELILFLVPILIKSPSLPLSGSGLASGEEGGDLSPRSISMLEAEEGAGKQVAESSMQCVSNESKNIKMPF